MDIEVRVTCYKCGHVFVVVVPPERVRYAAGAPSDYPKKVDARCPTCKHVTEAKVTT